MGRLLVARTLPNELMRRETGTAAGCTATLAGGGQRTRVGAVPADATRSMGLGEASLNDAPAIAARAG
jgi:hypothetical protein